MSICWCRHRVWLVDHIAMVFQVACVQPPLAQHHKQPHLRTCQYWSVSRLVALQSQLHHCSSIAACKVEDVQAKAMLASPPLECLLCSHNFHRQRSRCILCLSLEIVNEKYSIFVLLNLQVLESSILSTSTIHVYHDLRGRLFDESILSELHCRFAVEVLDGRWYDPRWTRTDVVDRFLVGLHGPDKNPVGDSVRMLEGTPQRLRK